MLVYLTIPTLKGSKTKFYNLKTKIYNDSLMTNCQYMRAIGSTTITNSQWQNRGQAENREKSIYQSLKRTKDKIIDYALANYWEWFVTFTLSPDIVDRFNYDLVSKKVSNWFKLTRKRKAPNMEYLVVAEQHKDGAWHFHALISSTGDLEFIDSGKKDKGRTIFNLKDYRLGHSTATQVTDTQKVSYYLSKYITKSLVQTTFNKKRYWVSKNLKLPFIIKEYIEVDDFINVLSKNINNCEHYKFIPLVDEQSSEVVQAVHVTTHINHETLPAIVRESIAVFGTDCVRIINSY